MGIVKSVFLRFEKWIIKKEKITKQEYDLNFDKYNTKSYWDEFYKVEEEKEIKKKAKELSENSKGIARNMTNCYKEIKRLYVYMFDTTELPTSKSLFSEKQEKIDFIEIILNAIYSGGELLLGTREKTIDFMMKIECFKNDLFEAYEFENTYVYKQKMMDFDSVIREHDLPAWEKMNLFMNWVYITQKEKETQCQEKIELQKNNIKG